jgi:probable F420-dependent oxidoreductase
MNLGRVGIWSHEFLRPDLAEVTDLSAELEELGYGALWASGNFDNGFPPHFQTMLNATRNVTVASGILSIWHASPADVAGQVARWENDTDGEHAPAGRFLAGLGASHSMLIESQGGTYAKPYSKMVSYLDDLDDETPALPTERRVLAALGPRMLRLAAHRAAGAHPYFVPVEHTAEARQALGPGPVLAPEQAVVLESDPAKAREIARSHMSTYLMLTNYTNNLRRFGFTDDDLSGAGSDRIVDAIVAWGDEEAIAKRVADHLAAGADHVALQVLSPPGVNVPREQYRRIAAAAL